jgi:hypothetical protein
MQHLGYSFRYSVVRINSSLLTTTLHDSVRVTLVYDDTKSHFHDVTSEFDCNEVCLKVDDFPTTNRKMVTKEEHSKG